jgi:S1-C subfamily serine protease
MISNHAGLAGYFGTAEGVVVLRIDPENPLRLQDGDVVLSIDGESVSRPVEIGRVLLGRGGDTVSLEVMRAGERITIDAELPGSKAVSALLRQFHPGL